MDRELCVLIYSEFSQASKRLIDYIQSLPYDFAAVTGMSMLAADTDCVREKLKSLSITSVPCIFIKYFDGKTTLYTDDNVVAFINAISSSLVNPIKPEKNEQINIDDVIEKPVSTKLKKEEVMEAARAMQQARESKETELKIPSFSVPSADGLQRKTKLL